LFDKLADTVYGTRNGTPKTLAETSGREDATDVVTSPGMPTADELKTFLAGDTRPGARKARRRWSDSGKVPYAKITGDKPGEIEYGVLDVHDESRTQATRKYNTRPY
ncbi:MAG TPA: hypothetical protein VGO07_02800, partial [Candidatus Saccharimonadales bacterium]|jgi:hypothetical protein|nr:hypothetical protein [Candidatus Saccharimonadales bacterium]